MTSSCTDQYGSIVAREYGIPAVLGTGAATRRSEKSGGTAEKPWNKVSVKVGETWYATFDTKLGDRLMTLKENQEVELEFVTDAKGFHNIVAILKPTADAQPAEASADTPPPADRDPAM